MSLDQTTISRRKCGLIDFDSELTAGGYTYQFGGAQTLKSVED